MRFKRASYHKSQSFAAEKEIRFAAASRGVRPFAIKQSATLSFVGPLAFLWGTRAGNRAAGGLASKKVVVSGNTLFGYTLFQALSPVNGRFE